MAAKPSDVRRPYALVTPAAKGTDVKQFQRALNTKFNHFKIDRQITVDGDYGPQTFRAARQIGLCMGAVGNNRKALGKGRVPVSLQHLIRDDRKATKRERRALKRRRFYRRKLRKQFDKTAGEKVMGWARSQVGTTEDPAGSNWGPRISEWIKFTGYTGPVFWCGCFACYAVVKIGGAKVAARIRIGYTGYIIADAKAGVNGLVEVPFDQARAGDIVVFTFDHIGLVDRVEGDSLHTVEGNTSSGTAGSQSNGGGVFARVRSRGDVALIARPDY